MKHFTAAAILAFYACHAVAAPVGKREAAFDILSMFNSWIPNLSNMNPNDDSPFNPFDDPNNIGKRSVPIVKRSADAAPNIFGNMKKIMNAVPGLQEFGNFIPGFNGLRNIAYLGASLIKRDAEPEPMPEPVPVPEPEAEALVGVGDLNRNLREFDNIGKRDAKSDGIEKREPGFFDTLQGYLHKAKELPFIGPALMQYWPLPLKKRAAAADPDLHTTFRDILNSMPDFSLLGGPGGIPGITSLETAKKLFNGEFFNGVYERPQKRAADPQFFGLGAMNSVTKMRLLDNIFTELQLPKFLEGLGFGGKKSHHNA